MKIQLPKINFNLTEKQKQFTAIIVAITLAFTIFAGVAYFTNSSFKNFIFPSKNLPTATLQGTELNSSLENLSQSLSKLNIDDIVYTTIDLDSIPVYPKSWVVKHFSPSEIQNALISGPSGDPDNDGLSNKQEFFFGSDPRNKDTLCSGKTDAPGCVGKTDGENVAANISPLTGGAITNKRTFKLNKQNGNLIDTLQTSFENSSKEGVDFPTLYQLSKDINLDDYYNSFSVISVNDTRDSFAAYLNLRASIIQGFIDDSELNSLTEIYSTNDAGQLKVIRDLYQTRLDSMKNTSVPQRYTNTHKAYLVIFSKIVALVDYRIEGVNNNTLDNEDYQTGSKKLAVETVWGYRKLSTEVAKLNGN